MQLVVKSEDRTVGVFDLADDAALTVGSSPEADCRVDGERYLSRRHVVLRVKPELLEVERLATAKNPVLFKGSATDRFRMNPGEYFVIGTTIFSLHGPSSRTGGSRLEPRTVYHDAAPAFQFTMGMDEVRARGGSRDRMRLLDLMELPEVLRTRSRPEFFVYACGLLRMAASARWVQVLRLDDDDATVLAEDARLDQAEARPVSRALMEAARAQASQPVAYCWTHQLEANFEATAHEGIDWALCCAMPVPGEAPVVFYVAGGTEGDASLPAFDSSTGAQSVLRDTARLVGLVADMIGRAISLQKMEAWQNRLGHFFSGKLVSKILAAEAEDDLAPRIAEATVMFFDIRGFSRMTEGNLQRILEHQENLRRVLTAMTQHIFDHDGIVIRYMGDGIMACWNVPYAAEDHVDLACLAAVNMVSGMADVTDGWECGIGLGMGELVAGSLGSEQVYAYDILGGVVNVAARVEGITKIVGAPVLVTDKVARRVSADKLLTRRVARFRPAGMDVPVDLFTLDPTPADPAARQKIDERFDAHAKALEAFEAGDWDHAFNLLHPIVQEDPAARYVYKLALQMQTKPPREWDGVVELSEK